MRHAFGDLVVREPARLSGREVHRVDLGVLLVQGAAVAVGGGAAESQVGGIRRDGELLHAVSVARGPALFRFVGDGNRPQMRWGAFRVHDAHVEFLFFAFRLILVHTVGSDEEDAGAVVAPGPGAHRRRMFGELHGSFFLLEADQPELPLFSLASGESRPLAVAAEGESVDGIFSVADLASLAAINAHQVELVGAVAVGEEAERAAVARPFGLRLVLLFGEGHLAWRAGTIGRSYENVGEVLSRLPLGDGNRVKDVLAVGRDAARADAAHLDDVHERHRPRLARKRGDEGQRRKQACDRPSGNSLRAALTCSHCGSPPGSSLPAAGVECIRPPARWQRPSPGLRWRSLESNSENVMMRGLVFTPTHELLAG